MSTLKVSLPPHLRETLEPLRGILPPELDELVLRALEGSQILYQTLADVSKWALTDEGKNALESHQLNYRDYDRISLLAGTTTGPSMRLPPPEPKPEPWETAQDEKNTRRAIAALVNAIFSVVGIGAAVWWASKTAGWSEGVRISAAVVGGLIAAVAEGGLFAIYYNRRENAKEYRKKQRERKKAKLEARFKKIQPKEIEAATTTKETPSEEGVDGEKSVLLEDSPDPGPLRRRRVGGEEEED